MTDWDNMMLNSSIHNSPALDLNIRLKRNSKKKGSHNACCFWLEESKRNECLWRKKYHQKVVFVFPVLPNMNMQV